MPNPSNAGRKLPCNGPGNVRGKRHWRALRRQNQGVAILIFLTIIVLGVITLLVTQLSPNSLKVKRHASTSLVLDAAVQALVGYSLRQAVPGELPCPDSTGDGLPNVSGAGCVDQLGLVPFRALELDNLTDATGATLWYAVSLDLLSNAATLKNSSLGSTLTLDGLPVAAVVIAPGGAINGQNRVLLNVADFLEGVNADANRDDFVSTINAVQNDQMLAVRRETLWPMVETLASSRAANLLSNYRANCGEYPWAAAFGGAPDSVDTLQAGALPLGSALPFNWSAACGASVAPAVDDWLATHWQDQFFYRMCTVFEGDCVTIANSTSSPAAAVVIAPGISMGAQARPSAVIGDYFEDENSDVNDADFKFLTFFDRPVGFNDTLTTLP